MAARWLASILVLGAPTWAWAKTCEVDAYDAMVPPEARYLLDEALDDEDCDRIKLANGEHRVFKAHRIERDLEIEALRPMDSPIIRRECASESGVYTDCPTFSSVGTFGAFEPRWAMFSVRGGVDVTVRGVRMQPMQFAEPYYHTGAVGRLFELESSTLHLYNVALEGMRPAAVETNSAQGRPVRQPASDWVAGGSVNVAGVLAIAKDSDIFFGDDSDPGVTLVTDPTPWTMKRDSELAKYPKGWLVVQSGGELTVKNTVFRGVKDTNSLFQLYGVIAKVFGDSTCESRSPGFHALSQVDAIFGVDQRTSLELNGVCLQALTGNSTAVASAGHGDFEPVGEVIIKDLTMLNSAASSLFKGGAQSVVVVQDSEITNVNVGTVIYSEGVVRVVGSQLVNGASSSAIVVSPGGRRAGGELTIEDSSFVNFQPRDGQAVVWAERANTVSIEGSSFVDTRRASQDFREPALFVCGIKEPAQVVDSEFVSNESGAIVAVQSGLFVERSSFRNNGVNDAGVAVDRGGAIGANWDYSEGIDIDIGPIATAGCSSRENIQLSDGNRLIDVVGSEFTGNQAEESGGAIFVWGQNSLGPNQGLVDVRVADRFDGITRQRTLFTGNRANRGSAIRTRGVDLSVDSVTMSGNEASGAQGTGPATIVHGTLDPVPQPSGSLEVSRSQFRDNLAPLEVFAFDPTGEVVFVSNLFDGRAVPSQTAIRLDLTSELEYELLAHNIFHNVGDGHPALALTGASPNLSIRNNHFVVESTAIRALEGFPTVSGNLFLFEKGERVDGSDAPVLGSPDLAPSDELCNALAANVWWRTGGRPPAAISNVCDINFQDRLQPPLLRGFHGPLLASEIPATWQAHQPRPDSPLIDQTAWQFPSESHAGAFGGHEMEGIVGEEHVDPWFADLDQDGVIEIYDCDDADSEFGIRYEQFRDLDGDGLGDASSPYEGYSCFPVAGFVENDRDCVDEGIRFFDRDGDGLGSDPVMDDCEDFAMVDNNEDCDDENPRILQCGQYFPSACSGSGKNIGWTWILAVALVFAGRRTRRSFVS